MQRVGAALLGRRLAVMVDSKLPALQLVEAAGGDWSPIWVVDRDTVTGVATRVLRRLGDVVDITGLDGESAAQQVAQHSAAGIIAFAEEELERAARIGTMLGLAVDPPDVVRRLTNKYAQRLALRGAGLPGPHFWPVPSASHRDVWEDLVRGLGYPVIVKPQQGKGSLDVARAQNAQELRSILEANNKREHPSDLLVETLLPDLWQRDERLYADFVSVESVVTHGKISHLAITGRSTLQEPFIETGSFIPSNLAPDVAHAVTDMAGYAIAALGVRSGVMHTEVKVTPEGPQVVEVNGRVGGAVPELVTLATDGAHSILRIACRAALGEILAFDELLPCNRIGYSLRVPPPVDATRLVRIDGVDAVRGVPGVSAFEVMRRAGDAVDWREGWDACIYFAFGAADDHDAMWAAREQIRQAVELEFA